MGAWRTRRFRGIWIGDLGFCRIRRRTDRTGCRKYGDAWPKDWAERIKDKWKSGQINV